MGVMGKIVGGTIGFAIGGPLGAIAGAAFGHVIDKSNVEYQTYERLGMRQEESSQLTFYVAAFSMLAKIIKADGRVDQAEIHSVEQFMDQDLNLDPFGKNIARNIFYAALESDQRFEDFARQFYSAFYTQPQLLALMMDILFRVASADKALNDSESRMLQTAAEIFGFDPNTYKAIAGKYGGRNDRAYAVLQSARADSNEAIKSRYRKLVADYHPDKVAAKGLPEEFIKFANDKFIEIQNAYDEIKEERGIS